MFQRHISTNRKMIIEKPNYHYLWYFLDFFLEISTTHYEKSATLTITVSKLSETYQGPACVVRRTGRSSPLILLTNVIIEILYKIILRSQILSFLSLQRFCSNICLKYFFPALSKIVTKFGNVYNINLSKAILPEVQP